MLVFLRRGFPRSVGVAAGAGALLLAGCLPSYSFVGDGGVADDGPSTSDAARDARDDAPKDAGHDSGKDATLDGRTDGPVDAAKKDAPVDARTDATTDATADATSDGPPTIPDASGDTSVDFPDAPPFDAPPVSATPFTVLATGASVLSMGFGQQTHVVHVEGDSSYWLFYAVAGSSAIDSFVMPDGTSTWTAKTSIPLSLAINDGNNFSVAYAHLGSTDVLHIAADLGPPSGGEDAAFDIRATIAGSTLSAGTPSLLPGSTGSDGSVADCTQDGPSVAIASDGTVYDATGWLTHPNPHTECDTNIFQSASKDTGASAPTTFAQTGYYVSQPDIDFSHDLLAFGDAGVLAMWPDWDGESSDFPATTFQTFGWAATPFALGSPYVAETEPEELFYNSGSTPPASSYNDWAACRLSDTDIHLVRHVLTGYASLVDTGFEEEIYDGSSWTPSTTSPPSVTAKFENGIALVSKAGSTNEMLLVAIDEDNALDVSLWQSGTWTAVGTVAPSGGNTRSGLAGSGCGGPKAMVFWTESTGGSSYAIKGIDLTSLLP